MKKLISLLLVLLLAASALAAVAEAAQWTCPGCGAVNDGNFCMECGTPRPAQVVCPGCGAVYPADTANKFCSECGSALNAEPAAEALTVDPEAGRFATPEDAAMRYIDGLRERDLDKMLSATDWVTLESHRTLQSTVARMKNYNFSTWPTFPRDDGMLSAMNLEQMRASTAMLIRRAMLCFVVTGPDGESIATGGYVSVDPENIDALISQFDMTRIDSLARITDVQFIAPEQVVDIYTMDANQRNLESLRVMYGADEIRDLCVTFTIDGRQYVVCPGCVRYGDVWTMYGPGLLAAILGISVDRQAFAAVDEIG